MEKDSGIKLDVLRTDGGMVVDDLLMQFQADILNRPVVRPKTPDSTTSSGAACAAGLAKGYFKDLQDFAHISPLITPASRVCRKTSAKGCISFGRVPSRVRSIGSQKTRSIEAVIRGRVVLMHAKFFGEFMGTLVLVLLGDGVVANVLLKKSKAEGAGWMVITAGWAFAVMAGIFVAIACGSSDAHLNPAVTLGFALYSGQFVKLVPYVAAQLLGAFAGATLVWLHFLPHWERTDDPALKLAVFCTAPAIRKFAANLISEIIGTLVLVFVVGAMFSKAVAGTGFVSGLGAYLAAALIWGIGLSLGGTTGYAINPARDLGPRLAHSVLPVANKGTSDWSYAIVPVLGPLIGGALAGGLMRVIGF